MGSHRPPTRRWLAAGLAMVAGLAGCQSDGANRQSAIVPPETVAAVRQASLEQPASEPLPPPRPAVPPATAEYPIDLDAALRLAGVENPTIAIAEEAVRAGQAAQLQARTLLLPTLHAGLNYHQHDGNLQTGRGLIRNVDSQDEFIGAGASAVGAGTVTIPGVYLYSHLGNALFEPLAARQRLTGLMYSAQATRHNVLLDVAERYLALAAAEDRLAAIRLSEKEFAEIARLTENFARAGQGRQADAERARSELLLLRDEAAQAEGEIAVASADLAQVLSLDPAVRLHAASDALVPVTLVPPDAELAGLVGTARLYRPEVAAASSAVAEAQTRLRQERTRPLLPLVGLGLSAGAFGGGSNQAPYRFDGRTDFDVFAVWSLQNAGVGNVALAHRRRADLGAAAAEQQRILDQVGREVSEALADVKARQADAAVARRQLNAAEAGYQADLRRARNIEGRPIELLNSARLLAAARQEVVRAAIGYNQAEFRLFVALGQPPIPLE